MSYTLPANTVKIYTRTGDTGDTSLVGGTRVRKSDPRVEAYGDIDELNAWLGLARASGSDRELDDELARVQRDLFALGAQLADPADRIAGRIAKADLGDDDVARLERLIDRGEAELPPLKRFILAGAAPPAPRCTSHGPSAAVPSGGWCRSSHRSTPPCCGTSTACPISSSYSRASSTIVPAASKRNGNQHS